MATAPLQLDDRWRLVTDASPAAAGGHAAKVYEWTGDGPPQHRVLSDSADIDLVVSCEGVADQLELADWIADSIADGSLRRTSA